MVFNHQLRVCLIGSVPEDVVRISSVKLPLLPSEGNQRCPLCSLAATRCEGWLGPAVNAGEVLCDCADRWKLAKTRAPTTTMAMRAPPYMRRLRRARCRASSMSALTMASTSERVNESVELMDYASITSTMLSVKVNKSDPTDLYEQVAAEIRRAIAEGEAKPGERLPPAKDLAAVLGVNTNTVLRSLRLLRDEGLLELRRGRGISVAGTPELGAVVQRARELVDFARRHGYRVDELVDIIEDVA
jgi:GntR family transcriptional regulator